MKTTEKKSTLLITGYNSETVDASTSIADAFEIPNKSHTDVTCGSLILKFKQGLEDAQIDIDTKHLGNESDLLIEPVELCTIGTPKNSQFIQAFRFHPFRWPKGNNVKIKLGTKSGQTIDPRDVQITFNCDY